MKKYHQHGYSSPVCRILMIFVQNQSVVNPLAHPHRLSRLQSTWSLYPRVHLKSCDRRVIPRGDDTKGVSATFIRVLLRPLYPSLVRRSSLTHSCSGRAHLSLFLSTLIYSLLLFLSVSFSCIVHPRYIRACGRTHVYVCVCFVRDVQQLVLELLVKRGTSFNAVVYLCTPLIHVYIRVTCIARLGPKRWALVALRQRARTAKHLPFCLSLPSLPSCIVQFPPQDQWVPNDSAVKETHEVPSILLSDRWHPTWTANRKMYIKYIATYRDQWGSAVPYYPAILISRAPPS